MFGRLWCLLNRHAPKRSAVQWDGDVFVGHCRHCEQPIQRVRHGHWVAREG
ncbi:MULTISPECIES: hypothetical protein [Novosphingobium]|uniref:hypothetical protein n=1 Tax=Novosphingobium TaxID=165696 RepID=UPI001CD3B054|nr:hypothetical protein [Novosphingobium percolationis]